MTEGSHLSIWFFVGILLTFYGLIITGAGIYGLFVPPHVELAAVPRRPVVGPDPPGDRRLLLLSLRAWADQSALAVDRGPDLKKDSTLETAFRSR